MYDFFFSRSPTHQEQNQFGSLIDDSRKSIQQEIKAPMALHARDDANEHSVLRHADFATYRTAILAKLERFEVDRAGCRSDRTTGSQSAILLDHAIADTHQAITRWPKKPAIPGPPCDSFCSREESNKPGLRRRSSSRKSQPQCPRRLQ
jgi:hypothetical protein